MKYFLLVALVCLTTSKTYAQYLTSAGGSVSTGKSGEFCGLGSFSDSSHLNTNDLSDFCDFSLPAGVGCSYYISTTLNGTGVPGTFAGFYVAGENLLSLLSGIRIKTYYNGALQETASGTTLLHLLIYRSGDIYFQTTKHYDEVRMEIDGLATVAYSLKIFYAFGRSSPPVGVVLPVYLKNFTAKYSQNGFTLNWSVPSGNHLLPIEIYRSEDGQHFQLVKIVPALQDEDYFYFDAALPVGDVYYQLKLRSTTGKTIVSPVVIPSRTFKQLSLQLTASTASSVRFTCSGGKGVYKLRIVGVNGHEIALETIVLKGKQSIEISVENKKMRPGIYIALLTDENGNSRSVKFNRQ